MPFPILPHRLVDTFDRPNESPIASPWTSLSGEAVQSAIATNALTGASDDFYQARYEPLTQTRPLETIALYRAFAFVGTGGVLDTGSGTLATRTGYSWTINDAGGGLMDAALREESGSGTSADIDTNASSPLPTSGDRIGCQVLANGDISIWVEYTGGVWTEILSANDSTWTTGKLAFGGFGVGTQIDAVTVGVVASIFKQDSSRFPNPVPRRRN